MASRKAELEAWLAQKRAAKAGAATNKASNRGTSTRKSTRSSHRRSTRRAGQPVSTQATPVAATMSQPTATPSTVAVKKKLFGGGAGRGDAVHDVNDTSAFAGFAGPDDDLAQLRSTPVHTSTASSIDSAQRSSRRSTIDRASSRFQAKEPKAVDPAHRRRSRDRAGTATRAASTRSSTRSSSRRRRHRPSATTRAPAAAMQTPSGVSVFATDATPGRPAETPEDRRRRVLENRALSSLRKPGSTSTRRRRRREHAQDAPVATPEVTRRAERRRDPAAATATAASSAAARPSTRRRRRHRESRTSEARHGAEAPTASQDRRASGVDGGDGAAASSPRMTLADAKEQVLTLETQLLQWHLAHARLLHSARLQEENAMSQWHELWSQMEKANRQQATEQKRIDKEQYLHRLEHRLEVQRQLMFPLEPHIDEFVQAYEGLSATVYSTAHQLPTEGVVLNMEDLTSALQDAHQELAGVQQHVETLEPVQSFSQDFATWTDTLDAQCEQALHCVDLLKQFTQLEIRERSLLSHQLQLQRQPLQQ